MPWKRLYWHVHSWCWYFIEDQRGLISFCCKWSFHCTSFLFNLLCYSSVDRVMYQAFHNFVWTFSHLKHSLDMHICNYMQFLEKNSHLTCNWTKCSFFMIKLVCTTYVIKSVCLLRKKWAWYLESLIWKCELFLTILQQREQTGNFGPWWFCSMRGMTFAALIILE